MKKLFQALFGRREHTSRSRADNAVALNDVLSRYREPAKAKGPGSRPAAAPTPEAPGRPAAGTDADGTRRLDFDLDGLALTEERTEGFNPYDTGRFSTAELWEKRHRNRPT